MRVKWIPSVFFILAQHFVFCQSKCIFDEVNESKFVKTRSSPSIAHNEEKHAIEKRSTSHLEYDSMRIKLWLIDKRDDFLTEDVKPRHLEKIFTRAIRKAEHIFSVIRHAGALLLKREEACAISLRDGRCAVVESSYAGEVCFDDFKIPDDHLEGMYEYSVNSTVPTRVIKEEGDGVSDADYILYVRSSPTSRCQGSSVQAYTRHCQLTDSNRPIAGFINVCPHLLDEEIFDENKAFLVVLHEIFHALGFSRNLFDKFQTCDDNGCILRRESDTLGFVEGATRLITPLVVNETSDHFSCVTHASFNEFGPILEHENDIIKSHWDGAFMYSSIMAPNIASPYETIIDNITLAYFEDTGWYKVNYSHAQNFPWGRDGGCEWGMYPQCGEMSMLGDCFCKVPEEAGCHYLRRSKGACQTDEHLHECYTYKSLPSDSCLVPENSPTEAMLAVTGEKYMRTSRCFLANLSVNADGRDMKAGRCYETRCNGTDVEIKVGDSPWTPCPYETTIEIEGYHGELECPEPGILCMGEDPLKKMWPVKKTSTTLTTIPTTSYSPTYPPEDTIEPLVVDIHFPSPDYSYLDSNGLIVEFMEACVVRVLHIGKLSALRVQNQGLRRGSTIFSFDLEPAEHNGDGPPSGIVVESLKSATENSEFFVTLPTSGETYTATRILIFDYENPDNDSPKVSEARFSTEVIIGIAFGCLIAAVLIVVALYFVQRFYIIHTQHQNRRDAYMAEVIAQRAATSSDPDSRHSSQSRASAQSRTGLSRSRTNSSNAVNMMMNASVDLEREPMQQHQQETILQHVDDSPTILDGAAPEFIVLPARTPDISFDPGSERTADSAYSSKPASRQRTPVSAGRKSRRSSYTQSSNSRTSSRDRRPSSTGSSNGRQRSRSRSRSSLKLRENSPFAQVRKNPSRRSQSTRSSEKPRVRIREDRWGASNKNFEYDDQRRGYPSPIPPRAIISKSHVVLRNNSQSGNRPRLRNPRPREMRRKTTQCVFSPRELNNTDNLEVSSKPVVIDIDFVKKKNNNNNSIKGTSSKCLDSDFSTSVQCQKQDSPCPLQNTNKHYDNITCPLQTPNCSKEDIKETDLPPPLINPRDSDLSFTLDLKDLEMSDSLSVYNAPRPQKSHKNQRSTSSSPTRTKRSPAQALPTPELKPPPSPTAQASSHSNGYHSTSASVPETQTAVAYNNNYNQKPQQSPYQPLYTAHKPPIATARRFNPPLVEQYAAPPVVEHLEQLPYMVPIIQLSAQDVHRASGSWRSFSSDTSIDSLSSPV